MDSKRAVSNNIRCPIKSCVQSCVHYIIHVSGVYNQLQYVYYYYISEHQLSPIIDASHTTSITRVNQNLMLLKLIGWRHCPCFRWIPYIHGTTTSVSWH